MPLLSKGDLTTIQQTLILSKVINKPQNIFRVNNTVQPNLEAAIQARGVLIKRYSENMLQICRRIPMLKCDFSKAAKQLY